MNKNVRQVSMSVKTGSRIMGSFIFALVMIPVFLTAVAPPIINDHRATANGRLSACEACDQNNFYITVYRDHLSEFQVIELERYLIGVVAAEMPALFELDALRAQAIAGRTYVLQLLQHEDYILDTVMHQVFLDDDQLKTLWGADFDTHFATISEAVMSTKGLVLKYDNNLITPMFFAMSSGKTENSEDVFASKRPYLRSIISDGYQDRDDFAVEQTFSIDDLQKAFDNEAITASSISQVTHSEGGNVLEIKIGDTVYTGRSVREILDLRSAAFSVSYHEDNIIFTTYGHGHGVGMSQRGANVMAQNGASYHEILQHYYQGVTIEEKYFANGE